MNISARASLSLAIPLTLSLAATRLAAQSQLDSAPTTAVWRDAFGMSAVDGALWAGGPDWRARIDASGVEFTPAFGTRAPRSFPLRLALASIGRETGPALGAGAVEPSLDGQAAVYERGSGIREIYEARRDGLEQSFVLDAPLAGGGDLVVRCALATELAPGRDGPGLAFDASGLGAVKIGAVTGIDAGGSRTGGTVDLVDGQLELRLPADFVDGARYPLVLDPLIGVDLQVDSDPSDLYDDVSPEVAHDTTAAGYLVVWTRAFSISDMDIRGQRVNDNGTLAGSLLAIENGTTVSPLATSPAVGNCNFSNTFLVAWESSTSIFATRDIKCRTVRATDGLLSANTITLAASAGNDDDPSIGGEATTVDDEVVVVWSEAGTGIRARQVNVPSGGNPTVAGVELAVSDASSTTWEDYRPAISHGGGFSGAFVVVWERYFSSATPPQYDLRAAAIDRNAALLQATTAVTSTSSTDETNADVDGEGSTAALIYESAPSAGGDPDVRAQHVVYNGLVGFEIGPAVDVAASVFAESDPAIVYTGDSFVAAYVGVNILSGDNPIVFQALDKIDLSACGSAASFSNPDSDYDVPALASEANSTTNMSGNVLAVAQARASSSAAGEIWAQRFEPVVGYNTELAGGCGAGGRAEIGCLLSTHSEVTSHVTEAAPSVPAFVVISPEPLDLPAGSCILVADPFHGFVLAGGSTNAMGEAHVNIAITPDPELVGLRFYEQWVLDVAVGHVVFGPGQGTGFDLSIPIVATFE